VWSACDLSPLLDCGGAVPVEIPATRVVQRASDRGAPRRSAPNQSGDKLHALHNSAASRHKETSRRLLATAFIY
jgi:hypothetical protein